MAIVSTIGARSNANPSNIVRVSGHPNHTPKAPFAYASTKVHPVPPERFNRADTHAAR